MAGTLQRKTVGIASTRRCPRQVWLQFRKNDLRVVDLYQVDIGHALAALFSGRSLLLELDLAIQAHQFRLPEGVRDRLGLGLTRLFDSDSDSANAVITAETLGRTSKIEPALFPFSKEIPGCGRIGRIVRIPGRERGQVERAVGGNASLINQLIR